MGCFFSMQLAYKRIWMVHESIIKVVQFNLCTAAQIIYIFIFVTYRDWSLNKSFKKKPKKKNYTLSSSSSSVRLSVSCEGWREGWLSCSQTVPVPVLERDMVARLNLYAEVDVPTVLMDVFPWYAGKSMERQK